MSNSSLATYRNITKNRTSPRDHKIDTITIHCFVGQVSAKQGVDYFVSTDRQVSSNYVVGYDGKIGVSVDEKDRAWTSSSRENDHRAVTIETACDPKSPYAVTEKAYAALIELIVDICKRNGIKELVWSNNSSDRKNHRNGCNMTVHRDFANTDCPGEYLYSRMGDIATKVNAKLIGKLYRVRKTWADEKSQTGAYAKLQNAIDNCALGYSVFDEKGNAVFVKGDVNGDGKVNAKDAQLTLRASAGLEKLTDKQKEAADINGDGKVTAKDAKEILRKSAGLK